MFNRSGITTDTYGAPKQILANVELQASVGCIVPQALGVVVGGRKIAKAGTPINVNLESLNAAAKAPAAGTAAAGDDPAVPAVPMNAVLLHDVDVTAGNANGTALIFGFVNLNRLDASVVAAITAAKGYGTPTTLLTFMKA